MNVPSIARFQTNGFLPSHGLQQKTQLNQKCQNFRPFTTVLNRFNLGPTTLVFSKIIKQPSCEL